MISLKTIGFTAAFISIATSQCVLAADGEGFTTSFGIRTWSAEWGANTPGGKALNASGALVDVIGTANAKATNVVIPFVAIRYGDFGLSGSTMLKKAFTLEGSNISFPTDRKEWDINASYYFGPNVSASVGYKKITLSYATSKGPIIALSASAPLVGNLGMYGTAVAGLLKTNVTDVVNLPNFAGDAKTGYNLLEGGVAYNFGPMVGLKGTAVTFGYRYQRVKAKGIFPITLTNGPTTYRDTIDLTSGPILGVVATF